MGCAGRSHCYCSRGPRESCCPCPTCLVACSAKRRAKKKYLKQDREKIMDDVWRYLWSATKEELKLNRTELISQLGPTEVTYLNEHWVPKEPQLICLYTQYFPNRLDQAVLRLFEDMTRFIDRIAKAEIKD